MAIKIGCSNNINAKLVYCAIILGVFLLLILASVFFIKKNTATNEAELNSQRISLSISSNQKKPVIAIVLGVIGSLKFDDLVELSSDITIGIPSYMKIDDDKKLLGYNVALNIPLESKNSIEEHKDVQAILLKNNDKEVIDKLETSLAKNFSYQAVYINNDEIYTYSYPKAENLLRLLQDKNLIFLSGLTDKDAVVYKVAENLNYTILKNNLVLDEKISSESIRQKLLELEKIAKESGFAIAMGNTYPLTIKMIKEWVSTLSDKNIKLVSIKEFYKELEREKLN